MLRQRPNLMVVLAETWAREPIAVSSGAMVSCLVLSAKTLCYTGALLSLMLSTSSQFEHLINSSPSPNTFHHASSQRKRS